MRTLGQLLPALILFTHVAWAQTAPPTLETFSPRIVFAGSPPFDLAVNGTGFLSGAVVKLGATLLDTAFQNSSQLVATVPSSSISLCGAFQVQASIWGSTPAPIQRAFVSCPLPFPTLLPVGVATITLGRGLRPYRRALIEGADVGLTGSIR
jgi:hypothetical protein